MTDIVDQAALPGLCRAFATGIPCRKWRFGARQAARQGGARDAANQAKLVELGWRVLIILECETRDREALRESLGQWLALEAAAEITG